MNSRERNAYEFSPFVVRQVRAGALSASREPDPPSIIRSAFRQHEGVIFGAAGFLWLTVAVFFYLDVSSYRLFTDDKILYTNYWTTERFEIAYGAVHHVETACWLNNKNEPVVGYEVFFDESASEDLLSFERLREDQLVAERIDQKLRTAGVSIRHATRRNYFADGSAFEAACLERLRSELGELGHARVAKLLHAGG